jgi:hypothetical protein
VPTPIAHEASNTRARSFFPAYCSPTTGFISIPAIYSSPPASERRISLGERRFLKNKKKSGVAKTQEQQSRSDMAPGAEPVVMHHAGSEHMAAAKAKLLAKGVVFESDSDSDLGDEPENLPSDFTPSLRSEPLGIWAKDKSRDLFEVAPILRPQTHSLSNGEPTPKDSKSKSAAEDLRAGVPKKTLWKNLLKIQCAERRSKFGDPHRIVERNLPTRHVQTTIQQPVRIEQDAHIFDVAPLERKEVSMSFEKFLSMPENPVIVRTKTRKLKGETILDLAYRNDVRNEVTRAGRRARDTGPEYPFARA